MTPSADPEQPFVPPEGSGAAVGLADEAVTLATSVFAACDAIWERAREPVRPVLNGSPVAFVRTAADGVPRFGVTSTGLVAKTFTPVPVLSVRAAPKFALEGVARKV